LIVDLLIANDDSKFPGRGIIRQVYLVRRASDFDNHLEY
jgi:hypothetical protein